GGGRSRACAADPRAPADRLARRAGARRGTHQLSDERLPQRLLASISRRRGLCRHHARQVRRHARWRLRWHAAQPGIRAQCTDRRDPGPAAAAARRVPLSPRPRRGIWQLGRACRFRWAATPGRADCMSVLAQNELLVDESPEDILRWAYANFARVAVVASFQAESSVIIDMVSKIRPDFRVLTLDTGRLPQETHDMIDRVRQRYRIAIDVLQPDPAEVMDMVGTHGTNLFFSSPDLRRRCCEVRKSRPLEVALRRYDAWITGLRREQSVTRAHVQTVTVDREHGGISKVAPLAAWSKAQVWDYIRANNAPYHRLYESGYTSIGCAPCTRATAQGEDERAGRWWWEQNEVKECGLHWNGEGNAS